MAKLTRYRTFRSLKQSTSAKSKRDANIDPIKINEVEKFMLLLQKKKPHREKTTKS